MSIKQLNFEGKNKVEVAVMRLKEFEPPEGYYFADSYGKDSSTVRNLLGVAAVKFDTHYSQGGIDPPELVWFGRLYHPEAIIERPSMSIFKAIQTRGMPRRQSRWCCEMIKEKCGSGRRVVTGIRWQESASRRRRRMFEVCHSDETKMFLHPIIDWTEAEVWEYIHAYNVPYCKLYDEKGIDGEPLFKRLGCVLCPMETARHTQIDLVRFPKLAEAWRRACYRYYDKGTPGVKRWSTAEEFWQWWLSRKGEPKIDEAQCIMFDN